MSSQSSIWSSIFGVRSPGHSSTAPTPQTQFDSDSISGQAATENEPFVGEDSQIEAADVQPVAGPSNSQPKPIASPSSSKKRAPEEPSVPQRSPKRRRNNNNETDLPATYHVIDAGPALYLTELEGDFEQPAESSSMAQTRTENTIDVDALPDDIGVPPSSRYLFSKRKGKGDLSNLIQPRNELPKLPSGNHFSSTSSSSSSSSSPSTTVTPKPISPLPSSKEPGQPLSTYNCPICFSPPTYATLTPCGHVLCGECLFTAVKAGIQRGALHGPASEMAKCPVCRATIPGWDGKGGGVIGLKPRVKVETVEYD